MRALARVIAAASSAVSTVSANHRPPGSTVAPPAQQLLVVRFTSQLNAEDSRHWTKSARAGTALQRALKCIFRRDDLEGCLRRNDLPVASLYRSISA